jgi:long-chain acyl-CoA synthetase
MTAFCEQNLPRYKRPRRIIFDQVPRSSTGKTEKPRLREKYCQAKQGSGNNDTKKNQI